MLRQNKYINEGAEEFIDSLREGTFPVNKSEKDFFEKIKKDSEYYLDKKIDRLEGAEYNIRDSSEEFLRNYYKTTRKKSIDISILSVDVVGSTKLSNHLNKETYARVISLFLRSITQIIHNYNGYSLKYIIAYFPGPDFEGMRNNALFCAYAIKKYILNILNPLLRERMISEISFRISLNSGRAMLAVVGHPVSRQHFDLIGEPINLTKKIQVESEVNSILLGESTNSFSHKFWKTKTQEVEVKSLKDFKIYKLSILV